MRPLDATWRYCSNATNHQVCNWLVEANDTMDRCWSCRLNQVIPNLNEGKNLTLWGRMESAKRRMLNTLYQLGLTPETDPTKSDALAFRFMADNGDYSEGALGSPVYTGHERGVITINLSEADAGARETLREAMNEPYRSLLGHFRHEIGHYFWDQLIRAGHWLNEYRALFGDEREDYQAALSRYYASPIDEEWNQHFISAYASSHPWEDWAESWAHYLHMFDGLETAHAQGFRLGEHTMESPLQTDAKGLAIGPWSPDYPEFESMVSDWQRLTVALNAMNRSMGLSDVYPFSLTPAVVEKLDFVHRVINDL